MVFHTEGILILKVSFFHSQKSQQRNAHKKLRWCKHHRKKLGLGGEVAWIARHMLRYYVILCSDVMIQDMVEKGKFFHKNIKHELMTPFQNLSIL